MADTPGTSSGEPDDIDIGAAREAFIERITSYKQAGHAGEVSRIDQMLINAVAELYSLLEHETRRIDIEVTQAVTPPET